MATKAKPKKRAAKSSTDIARWQQLAATELKGKPSASLDWQTPEGIAIKPLYTEADLEEVYNTERHLLYVACTRARDHLLVTSVDPPSEFLDDLRSEGA